MEFARESNQTLIGFLRPPSFNVYSHIERVDVDSRMTMPFSEKIATKAKDR
jgi:hypothetical protein